jgi:hypothetical protein
MTPKRPETRTVRIVQKSPVAWLNLQLLVDTGILAAVSSYTGSRSPRREVMAALDRKKNGEKDYFDYSEEPGDEVWIDFIADLGDGFNATHSIAWLVGRDYLGLGEVGKTFEQPLPPNPTTECDPIAFSEAKHVLPAGKITIFGGDLVYPFATLTEYEDRTVGPYLAARPWQLKAGTDSKKAAEAEGRRLFSIPGNHDWYDGLSAYVQRFCQPGRWMGCWQVKQRRSYFAIKLPHKVWIWGVDLATEDNFDAPQLEYFTSLAKVLKPGDEVILCVPKPAWVDREEKEGDWTRSEKPTPSWESWKKVERIKDLIAEAHEKKAESDRPRIRAFLSGDLHHYSHYEAPLLSDPSATPVPDEEKTHFITCGGGGAFLLGTDSLPKKVGIGADLKAGLKEQFPDARESDRMCFGVLKPNARHWKLFATLEVTLMSLLWLLEVQRPEQFVTGPALFSSDFFRAIWSALIASPIALGLTLLTLFGFYTFANTNSDGKPLRAIVAGVVHFLAQLLLALLILRFIAVTILSMDASWLWIGLLLFLAGLGAFVAVSFLFSAYLLAASYFLNLHRQEVYSAQAIENYKGFLRIRVDRDGVTIYPVGLRTICNDWTAREDMMEVRDRPGEKGLIRRLLRAFMMGAGAVAREQKLVIPVEATHVFLPGKPLAPHLIEKPIEIKRKGLPG